MRTLDLYEKWQGGQATLTVESDVIDSDEAGADVNGVIFVLETPCDLDSESEFGLGSGAFTFPAGKGALRFHFAATDEQALAVRDAITAACGAEAESVHVEAMVARILPEIGVAHGHADGSPHPGPDQARDALRALAQHANDMEKAAAGMSAETSALGSDLHEYRDTIEAALAALLNDVRRVAFTDAIGTRLTEDIRLGLADELRKVEDMLRAALGKVNG